jgi:uncharacterized protein (DUF488 family)
MKRLSHVFTIGHGSKDIKELILELQSFNIEFLVDIRSKPYSKFHTQFNQNFLKYSVEEYHIKYGYLGNLLGGLPLDRACYTDGKVDYDKLKTKSFFIEGLERLQKANNKGYNVCVLCSESNPKECHRAKLIGIELQKIGIELRHIIGYKKEKTQNQVIFELTKGNGLNTIFGEEHFTSKKKYI